MAPGAIPVPRRLTNAAGVALTGTFSMTFSLYEQEAGGDPICFDLRPVVVTNGLFSDFMTGAIRMSSAKGMGWCHR